MKKLCGVALAAAVLIASSSVPAAAATGGESTQPQRWICKILPLCP